MISEWGLVIPTVVASFLASLVEGVEALTVVLAVGVVRGWRGALGGAGLAFLVLALAVAVLGPSIALIPSPLVQLGLGALLLLFGMRWLRKAILRAAGVLPFNDEAAAFDYESAALRANGASSSTWDGLAITTSFKITIIEGIEVVFIVIAMGGRTHQLLFSSSLGALTAVALVVLLGLALHRPVTMIPENVLKFVVGVLICAFATFWVGEGMGFAWPAEAWSLLLLNIGYLVAANIIVYVCKVINLKFVSAHKWIE